MIRLGDAVPSIHIRPLQWSVLPNLEDAPPLDDADAACLEEIRAVLAQHGKLNRFAIHLAHRHMVLAPGEVLIERPNPDGRTQHVTVGRLEDAPGAAPTTWLFDDSPALCMTTTLYCVCVSDPVKAAGCYKHGKSAALPEIRQKEEAALEKRIDRERQHYETGFPVAGHDRGRERRRRPDGNG